MTRELTSILKNLQKNWVTVWKNLTGRDSLINFFALVDGF